MKKNIIILGPPGSGKGTLAKKIIDKYKIPYVSTGEIFRKIIKNNDELSSLIKKYINNGKLVPDDIVVKIIKNFFLENNCLKFGFILDGFPRTLKQAEALEKMLIEINCKVDMVINIKVNNDVLIKRILGRQICKNCGAIYHITDLPPKIKNICDICHSELIKRNDDNEEILKERLNQYFEFIDKLINFYKLKKKLFVNLNGLLSTQEMFDCVSEKIIN